MKTKTIPTFILSMLCFLFIENLIEDTAWMESDIEVKILEEESEETWTEWFGNNYETILGVSCLIFATGVFSYLGYQFYLDAAPLANIEIPKIDAAALTNIEVSGINSATSSNLEWSSLNINMLLDALQPLANTQKFLENLQPLVDSRLFENIQKLTNNIIYCHNQVYTDLSLLYLKQLLEVAYYVYNTKYLNDLNKIEVMYYIANTKYLNNLNLINYVEVLSKDIYNADEFVKILEDLIEIL